MPRPFVLRGLGPSTGKMYGTFLTTPLSSRHLGIFP